MRIFFEKSRARIKFTSSRSLKTLLSPVLFSNNESTKKLQIHFYNSWDKCYHWGLMSVLSFSLSELLRVRRVQLWKGAYARFLLTTFLLLDFFLNWTKKNCCQFPASGEFLFDYYLFLILECIYSFCRYIITFWITEPTIIWIFKNFKMKSCFWLFNCYIFLI